MVAFEGQTRSNPISLEKSSMARGVQHHFDLAEAIAERNADRASAVMRAHIHAGRQVMLGAA